MGSRRQEQVGGLIHQVLSSVLREMNDPRLNLISISDVDISPDLKNVRVYWSDPSALLAAGQAGDGEISAEQRERDERFRKEKGLQIGRALKGAEGIFRRAIADNSHLRYVPRLSFYEDTSAAYGARVEDLLRRAQGTELSNAELSSVESSEDIEGDDVDARELGEQDSADE